MNLEIFWVPPKFDKVKMLRSCSNLVCHSVKKQLYPLSKSLRLEEKLAPHQHCMLQKRSYHQKNCRPFEYYMLQKLSYQTAVSPPNLAILFHSSHQKGAGGSPVLMQEQNKCSEYFNPAKLLILNAKHLCETKVVAINWHLYKFLWLLLIFTLKEHQVRKLDLDFETVLETNLFSNKRHWYKFP